MIVRRPSRVWLTHVAIFGRWNGTITEAFADLRNPVIRLCLVGRRQGHENEKRYVLRCVEGYEVLCMIKPTRRDYERGLTYKSVVVAARQPRNSKNDHDRDR